MKIFIAVSLLVLISAFIFGIGIEVGGGINSFGIFGIGLVLPTLNVGINVPVSSGLSVTGNFETLFSPTTMSSQVVYLATGGIRYDFNAASNVVRPFVGMDAGVVAGGFSYGAPLYFVFGPNAGVDFQISKTMGLYLKSAMRMLMLSSEGISILFSFTEITSGLTLNF